MQNNVTIGIPVYNEESLVERAIRSAAGQCARLIISDNASTDSTGDICRKLADEFSNIVYVRQPENAGATENWSRILEMVGSEYVMFLGAHDYLGQEATTHMLEKLNSAPDILCAYGELFYDYDGRTVEDVLFNKWKGGVKKSPQDRIKALLYTSIPLGWSVYGLFRTQTLKELFHYCMRPQGGDIILMGHVLAKGKITSAPGARYNAWVREKHNAQTSDYHERVLGRKVDNKKTLRNESKIAKHEMLVSANAPLSVIDRIYYRIMSTIYIGTFRYPGLDVAYYLLWVPVKILRIFIRINYRFKKFVYSSIVRSDS